MPGYRDDEKGQNKTNRCSKWLAGNRFKAKFSCSSGLKLGKNGHKNRICHLSLYLATVFTSLFSVYKFSVFKLAELKEIVVSSFRICVVNLYIIN